MAINIKELTPRVSVIPGMVVITETSTYKVERQQGNRVDIRRLAPVPGMIQTPVERFAAQGLVEDQPIQHVLPPETTRMALIIK